MREEGKGEGCEWNTKMEAVKCRENRWARWNTEDRSTVASRKQLQVHKGSQRPITLCNRHDTLSEWGKRPKSNSTETINYVNNWKLYIIMGQLIEGLV